MGNCCIEKALKGDLSDPSCNATKNKINWFFWGGIVLLVIALCIIGFFVYKKYFGTSYNNFDNFGDDNNLGDNFGDDNNLGDNFGDDNNLGDNFGNDNNLGDNFVADNFDKADLEILNMPVPSRK